MQRVGRPVSCIDIMERTTLICNVLQKRTRSIHSTHSRLHGTCTFLVYTRCLYYALRRSSGECETQWGSRRSTCFSTRWPTAM
uniref:Uncharacterized protein n=1 Tax=Hyaloperonospora arabidopsidis (strain Emoy2) TaxID=559515 RepID=M4BMG9_HYAAE